MALAVSAFAAGCAPARVNPLFEACQNYRLSSDDQVAICTEMLAGDATVEERSRALQTRGYIYYDDDRLDLAIADYDAAVALDAQLDPRREHRASLYFNRGRIRAGRNEYEAAVADFAQAAAINEGWSDPLSWSARIKSEHLSSHEGALADIEEAIRRAPHDEGSREMRCDILRRAGVAKVESAPCERVEL